MIVTHSAGAIKKFRRTSWRFQQTIEKREVSDARNLASTIIAAHGDMERGTVIIDAVIFDVDQITALCPPGSPPPLVRESSISAQGAEELHALLTAALVDAPDFLFIPTPKPFVFYADHDEWITFYANTRSHLNQIIKPLTTSGYKLIQDWHREF